jgi:hypothetical protein
MSKKQSSILRLRKLASMYDDVQGMELYKQAQLLFKQ